MSKLIKCDICKEICSAHFDIDQVLTKIGKELHTLQMRITDSALRDVCKICADKILQKTSECIQELTKGK